MPRFEPFAAIRYATDDLASVIAPPYDVLSDADVDALEARSVHNVVRIDVPRGGEDRYDLAAKTLREWLDEGVLVADPRPSFTIYRMRFTDSAGARRDIAGCSVGWKSLILRLAEFCRMSGPQPRRPPIAST